jgi:HD-GYP domain-containing protein (c-di-GMP phosphodiesterase class II)
LNASSYLDTLQNTQPSSIHRAILTRLIPLWLLLSLLLGGGAYWIESLRVDRFVLSLSLQATQRFERSTPSGLTLTPAPLLATRLDQLLGQTPFIGLRLYDANQQLLSQRWRNSALASLIPAYHLALERRQSESWRLSLLNSTQVQEHFLSFAQRQTALRLDDRFYVQSLLPLRAQNGKLQGYLEGIYQVAPQTAQAIGSRIGDTLFIVLLVITLASGALYPVILTLNRDSLRLTHNLLASNIELMRVLGSAIAQRDSDTDSHNYRVTLYAIELAQAMQRPAREIIALMAGAFLHDVGKIGISDTILLKPGPLTDSEFSVMKTHVNIGLTIIAEVKWLELAQDVVASHHERFDGSGYPAGLKGMQIPFNARLFAIVDVFDALTSARPYKAALSLEQAMNIMRQSSGSHFDPQILQHFERLAADLHARYSQAETASLRRKLSEIAIGKYFHQR